MVIFCAVVVLRKINWVLSTRFFESHFCFNFSGATAVEIPLPNFKVVSKTAVNWFYLRKCAL